MVTSRYGEQTTVYYSSKGLVGSWFMDTWEKAEGQEQGTDNPHDRELGEEERKEFIR